MEEDRKPRVTFYKHEVVGATQTYNFMKRLGFKQDETEYVVKMVRHHQFRFYTETAQKTKVKWLQKLGKDHWKDIFALRKADRVGNLKNKDKPVETRHMRDLFHQLMGLVKRKEAVFFEDLHITKTELLRLGVPKDKVQAAIAGLLAFVKEKKRRNNKKELRDYVKQHWSRHGSSRIPNKHPKTSPSRAVAELSF